MKRIKHPVIKSLAVFAIGTYILIGANTALETVHYTIKTRKDVPELRIAFLTDVHDSLFGDNQSELIDVIDREKCDIVILGGDLIDGNQGDMCFNSLLLAELLVAKYPCYYTVGNHERRRGDSEEIKNRMSEMGITVLEGNSADFVKDDKTIEISGIYSPDEFMETDDSTIINQLENVDGTSEKYKILIEHFPEDINKLCNCGFDLILSGHAHGGQWRIPFTNIGFYAPGQGLFPKYTGGINTFGNTNHIVSRGLKLPRFFELPRQFNRPELTIIDIISDMENTNG